MFKSTKGIATAACFAFALGACGGVDTASRHDSPKLSELSEVEIRIGGTPRELATDRIGYYGYGEAPTGEELNGWDIDIQPDGRGLPPGSGSAVEGEDIYQAKCTQCHGDFGEGVGRWPQLAGGFDTLSEDNPEKTVGSYWPYVSTLWDYIHRAMPFQQPQSLTDNEVYALTAYVLYMNDLIEEDYEVNQSNLAAIDMPNRNGFLDDPRPDTENSLCTENCRDPQSIKVTWDASALGVTPTAHFRTEDSVGTEQPADAGTDTGPGEKIYQSACGVCHDLGIGGAPALANNHAEWQKRAQQGTETLLQHAINGFSGNSGVMPPKGGQAQLTDEEVGAAVAYMLKQAGVD